MYKDGVRTRPGLTIKEISEILKISESTAELILNKALYKLKIRLEKLYEGGEL